MAQFKVKGNVFYVLEAGEEKTVFDDKAEVIMALLSAVGENKELDFKKLSILEVDVSKENRKIKTIPPEEIIVIELILTNPKSYAWQVIFAILSEEDGFMAKEEIVEKARGKELKN